MSDIIDEVGKVQRELGKNVGHTVTLRRSYDAPIEDVWDAITTAERINRWFVPISGDLRLGGRYQLQGNAGGEIVRCEPPHALAVTWEYGDQSSDVRVRLSGNAGGGTDFELAHEALVDEAMWAQFGPGAVGIGWDLTVLGLWMHLTGQEREGDPAEWMATPVGREFMTASGNAWGEAHAAFGAPADLVKVVTENTIKAYVP